MARIFHIPTIVSEPAAWCPPPNVILPPIGPGSQPRNRTLDETPPVQGMDIYGLHLPGADMAGRAPQAFAILFQMSTASSDVARDGGAAWLDLRDLPEAGHALISGAMGEGEVAIRMRGIPAIATREGVLAGVRMMSGVGVDQIEVAVPDLAATRAFDPVRARRRLEAPKPDGLADAPALMVELLARSGEFRAGDAPHVVNLTRRPHKETDLDWLGAGLGDRPVAAIELDQETTEDVDRIREMGAPAVQVNTGRACHLDGHMVGHAMERLDLAPGSMPLIENVGNLVCPAAFDLGEDAKVATLSATEGEGKRLK
jgi:hydrogenase-1 operon protein HyaF